MREKIQLEFIFNVSQSMLYNYISSPSGLSEWFADNVNLKGDKYTFIWDGNEENALLVKYKQDTYIKFKWEQDVNNKYYFEFYIEMDEITRDTSLTITDFSDKNEIEESKMWWENQIQRLKKIIGN